MSIDLFFADSTLGAWWVFWVSVAAWIILLGFDPFGRAFETPAEPPDDLLQRRNDDERAQGEDPDTRDRASGDDTGLRP